MTPTEVPYPPVDTTTPQLTLRAVVTGMSLGALLSICNIYAGLKIGWGMNMSITSALVGFALWQALRTLGARPLSILETNVNQTAASSAAAVSSAGLVAPIPALTMLTGYEYHWPMLVVWTLSVMLVGIVVGVGLRRQLVVVDRLPFPGGLAAAETLRQMYARGAEAIARVRVLGIGAAVAAAGALVIEYAKIPKVPLPGAWTAPAAVARKGIAKITLGNLTFMLDPSPLMAAVGALVGIRASASLFAGSVVAFGVLAPWTLAQGWSTPGPDDPIRPWFAQLSGSWLLWPGVAMMVTASLTSLAFSWRSVLTALRPRPRAASARDGEQEVPRRIFLLAIVAVTAFATVTQVVFFDIVWWTAIVGVLMTFLLAVVAGRVSGETNVTPVGAMGKVTQLLFGAIQPGSAAANLMAANVTGGAASQAGDLLHDFKAGALLGASPRKQAIAQVFGAVSGALAGSAGYLLMVPDARSMLGTEQWPAPAVQTWKAVAELFMHGIGSAAPGTRTAMLVAGLAGIALAALEKTLPRPAARWVPSPASMGLGFVIPAYQGLSMLLGALASVALGRWAKSWHERFMVVLAAGFIAGESLTGVGIAIEKLVSGGGGH